MRADLTTGSAALLVSLFAAGCGQEAAECPDDSALTYENFGKPFMEQYCLRCHASSVTGDARQGAPDDHNFETRELVKDMTDHIVGYAGAGPTWANEVMPPEDPQPSLDERRQLAQWLACGAP